MEETKNKWEKTETEKILEMKRMFNKSSKKPKGKRNSVLQAPASRKVRLSGNIQTCFGSHF